MEEFSSFNKAIVSNLVSEFGDKTFILSAILAMKYNGVLVFIGSSLGFILMTFLGSVVGYMIP
jgi:putative Ca2+/H+ antiporter (TMEM165/GDT1 family)